VRAPSKIGFAVVVLVVGTLVCRAADAYPWMIRHGYSGCATCHVDPSGEGLLTEYGRAQSVLLLSSRYGAPADEEPGRVKDFLFGVPTPDWLLAGAWARDGYLVSASNGKVVDHRLLVMRWEAGAQVSLEPVRAYGTLGFAPQSSAALTEQAWVTHATTGPNAVSREHWIGVDLADQTMLVRAGRMNVPFGLRNIEHTSWVRSETRSDVNQAQQHGIAFAAGSELLRGEVMAILGNYQVNPDRFRERGYSAYAELFAAERIAVGLSSKVTHVAEDPFLFSPVTRQAHGPFARWVPTKPLVVLAEGDFLVATPSASGPGTGAVGFVQLDFEPWQGLHFDVAGEALRRADFGRSTQLGTWLSAFFFFFPHFDARFDTIVRGATSAPTTTGYLFQMNAYL
jgi:hypothetical protein